MKAQNRGMLWVDVVGDRGSYAILTLNFPRRKKLSQHKGENSKVVASLSWGRGVSIRSLRIPETMGRLGRQIRFMTLQGLLSVRQVPP